MMGGMAIAMAEIREGILRSGLVFPDPIPGEEIREVFTRYLYSADMSRRSRQTFIAYLKSPKVVIA